MSLGKGTFRSLLCALLAASPAAAATIDTTWAGGAGSWSDAGQWSAGVPANGGGDTWRVFVDGSNPSSSSVTYDLPIAEIDELSIDADDTLTLQDDTNLAVVGGSLANAGRIELQAGANFSVLRAGGTVTLSGGGEIALGDETGNVLSGITGSAPHWVNQDNAIRGAGQIGIDVARVTNHGLIEATGTNSLELNPNLLGLANTGTLRADGGTLVLTGRNGGGFTNDGLVEAAGGGLVQLTEFASVGGGGAWRADAGRIAVGATSQVAGTGNVEILAGGTLEVAGQMRGGDLSAAQGASLEISGTLSLSGDFEIALTNELDWLFDASAVVELTGGVGAGIGDWSQWAALEIGGSDQGIDPGTHQGNPAGFSNLNLYLPELVVGPDAHVFLADLLDNGNRGGVGGAAEALYVDTLTFADGLGLLNLNGLHLYYNTLNGSQGQIIDQVVPEPGTAALVLLGLVGLSGARRSGQLDAERPAAGVPGAAARGSEAQRA